MLRFYGLRILKDYIGHIILIGLPVVLISLMTVISAEANPTANKEEMALFIGIVYIIMFQGFGAAYTFEGIEHDFFKPFKFRLRAAPVNPMRFVLANIVFGILVSYAQSLVILFFVIIVFNASVVNLVGVMGVLLLGAVFAQLLAALAILGFKKASKSQAFMTIYIIAAMIVAGFFFPLPESAFTEALSKFSSPLAWTHYAVYGMIDQAVGQVLLGAGLLMGFIVVVGSIVYKMSKRVVA